MMKYLQKLGKSLMLPVAVLPAAAVLMGIGYGIDPNIMAVNATAAPNAIAVFLVKAGAAIIDQLPILFAVGIAFGIPKKQDGAAALSGLVAYLIITTLLSPASVAALKGIPVEETAAAFTVIGNAFIGIISGLVAAACYDRFSETRLPLALSFFSGKRCVPIITSVAMLVVSGILFFIWPAIYSVLVAFGKSIIDLGPIGAGIYGFFNRLLIPTGLHHALNSVFWFDVAGINDIGNFWASTGTKGVTGMYQAGFFPIMMFGLPAAALAIYHSAKPEKKRETFGIMLAAGFACFFTGVTEPLEFSFMFLAPGLYVVHAALTGISMAVAAWLQTTAGFSFSAGLIDFVLSSRLPLANKPWMLLIMGIVFAVVYYVLFRFLIVRFNLKVPGREDDDATDETKVKLANNDFTAIAKIILEGLGGKENIVVLDNCATRLRIELKNSDLVNDQKIKSAGIAGIMRPGKNNIQIIVGTQVQFVADEMKKL